MRNLLIIDDDQELCTMLAQFLEAEGFSLSSAHVLEQGVRSALAGSSDMIILDLGLPDGNGLEGLKAIRQSSDVPIIILTGKDQNMDKVLGLELGADDYVAKPFDTRELVARIRAVLRRSGGRPTGRETPVVRFGDISVNRQLRIAERNDTVLDLTQTEFSILDLLAEANGQVVTREQLVEEVLGREASPFDRSLDVHVSNLRRKLRRAGDQPFSIIGTIRAVGYFLRMEEDPAQGNGE